MPDEFGALLRELELIRRWRPRFNVMGQPQRRRLAYVCVGRLPAPGVFLSAEFLGARRAIFIKDEDGLFTHDPKKDPTATHIPKISATELIAAASGVWIVNGCPY